MATTTPVKIPVGRVRLDGDLALPEQARGIVVFAHGSGSSRFSSRNRYVADFFREAGLGTLLFDLLTEAEEAVDERTAEHRFDIPLLGERLAGVVDWLDEQPDTAGRRLGLFGASTGAAAALVAAAQRDQVAAVVSRGGRPDLAGEALQRVRAPTLMIVGGADNVVIELNKEAAAQLKAEQELVIVPGATHLFPEPGKLEDVARLSRDWFLRFLVP